MAISGGFRNIDSSRASGITSDFYAPMNVRRGISESILLYSTLHYMEELRYDIRVTSH